MSVHPPIAVLADDLTGAAEIAAVGFRFGLKSSVLTDATASAADAGLAVLDTDSRLESRASAAQRVRAAAAHPAVSQSSWLYKKTDSVLRGPVRAELEALAAARALPRVLLVPANPALGRTVRDGNYFIDQIPLSRTAFAHDPHHPVRTARVLDLLGPAGALPVSIATAAQAALPAGIVVGEASSGDDLSAWARRVDDATLPAGAAAFFAALLRHRGLAVHAQSSAPERRGPVLIVSGTTNPQPPPRAVAPAADALRTIAVPTALVVDSPAPSAAARAWFDEIAGVLSRELTTRVCAPSTALPGAAASGNLRRLFAGLVAHLHARGVFNELVVEGGATAATIVRQLGWARLDVVHEWSPGIVTLRPASGGRAIALTLKPGSYPWPAALWSHVLPPRQK